MPIFDQGYQHWKGSLAGHAWRWIAITRQGLRVQVKTTRSYVRLLLIMAWGPALMLVVAMALWGLVEQGSETIISLLQSSPLRDVIADPHTYRHAVWTIAYSTFFKVEIVFIMLLVVLIGPNLISQDLRFNAMPLYFSRPITRLDYFLGKLGVIGTLVAAVAVLPAIVAYIMGICFSLDLSVVRDTWRLLPASILYGLVIVVSAGTFMLALSSLSRRSLYVGIAWFGFWIISMTISTVLDGIEQESMYRVAAQEEAQAVERARESGVPSDPVRAAAMQGRFNPNTRVDVWQRSRLRADQAMAEAAKTDWRPLCSYTANVRCIGDALLGTDSAWVEIGRAIEGPRGVVQPLLGGGAATVNDRRLADKLVLQYPWMWSAGVLAGLLGLSICILSTRVKSLDRLK
jgi:ABC-2 type transport system permease protein